MTEQTPGTASGGPLAGEPPVAWEAPTVEVGPAPGVEWAGYGARLIAYLIDGLVLSVAVGVLALVFAVAFGFAYSADSATGNAFAGVLSLAAFLLVVAVAVGYFPFFWARGGQTPGMRPFGIRVVRDRDGGPVSTGAAVIRLFGLWISAAIIYLGFIWVFIDRRRRGWHDLFAGTVVVRDPNR